MDIILKQDVPGLGTRGAMVKVRPGYGRNYLIPQGLAMVASPANRKISLENARQVAHKVAQQREAAASLAARLDQLTLKIAAKAGDQGKIFGAITLLKIANALREEGIVVDTSNISLPHPIKELGKHEAILTLHPAVQYTLTFHVVASA